MASRRWLGVFTALILLIPVVAVSAPDWVGGLSVWAEEVDARLDDLEARVAALEGSTTSEATTTTHGTTTTTVTTTITSTLVLTEDLVVTGQFSFSGVIEANGFQIIVDGGTLDWDGFEVRNVARILWEGDCGVSTLRNGLIIDSGTTEGGFFPLHWNLCGDSTRGTVVENVTIENSANKAFVPHGSNGISLLNVTAKNIAGPALWWNPPGSTEDCTFQKFCTQDNSNDILVDGMTVYGVTLNPGDNRGFRLAAYVLGAGSGNIIRNSSAVNVGGQKDCAAYQWPEGANQNVGGNVWVFENNTGTSACHGIFVWQNDSNEHIIDGFVGGGISQGAYVNNYLYRNVDVPYVLIHALGWRMETSVAGDVTALKHALEGDPVVFDGVAMTSFTVNNASNGGEIPGTYVLNGSGLTCDDIIYESVVPDTTVIIDGEAC